MPSLLVLAASLAVLAGCSCTPEVIACPPVEYTREDLEECECGTPMDDGLVTAVIAAPRSYDPGRPVSVSLAGRPVAFGETADDGSLALQVTVPGSALAGGADLEVVVDRTRALVHVPTFEEAVVVTATDLQFVMDEPEVLGLEGTVRAIQWIDCTDPLAPTPAPFHTYAANLTTGEATMVMSAPLDQPFAVSVPGLAGDLAIVAVAHEGGAVSGCYFAADVCCSCPAGSGHASPFRRARCSARLRELDMCVTRVEAPDAGTDAGHDGGIDASIDAGVDAHPLDDADLDADLDVGLLPEGGPN